MFDKQTVICAPGAGYSRLQMKMSFVAGAAWQQSISIYRAKFCLIPAIEN